MNNKYLEISALTKYIKYKIFYEQLFAKNKHHKLTYV